MELNSRQVDALVFAENSAVHDLANYLGASCPFNAQLDQAVRKQDAVAGSYFPRQRMKGRTDSRGIAQHFRGGNDKFLARAEQHGAAARERAGAGFWALAGRQ